MMALVAQLHEQVGRQLPVDPIVVARAAGVRVHRLSGACPAEEIVLVDRAFYRWDPDQGVRGLRVATALAGSLAMRRAESITREQQLEVAAELIAPTWALAQTSCESAVERLVWAPRDLVRARWLRLARRRQLRT